MLFIYFLFPPNPFNKLARAKLAHIGELPYKKDRRFQTFPQRDFAG